MEYHKLHGTTEYIMYLRKSRQDDENETVEEVLSKHEKILQDFAVRTFGYRIKEDDIYREVVSGETIDDRPQVKAVFERLQTENIKGVLVVEPSRLTRGDMIDCGVVVQIFRYTKTLVVTPMMTYNLEKKQERSFFENELTKGNYYLEYTKEILARGREISAKQGNWIHGKPPLGYDIVKINKAPVLQINEKEAIVVRKIFELYVNEGIGYYEIANRMNALGFRSKQNTFIIGKVVNDILKNPVYIGKIQYRYRAVTKVLENGKVVKKRSIAEDAQLIDGKHQPIIDMETWNKAQDKRGKNTQVVNGKVLSNVFSGIMKCAKCGRSIGRKGELTNAKAPRYYCRNRQCDTVSETCEIVDKAVIDVLKQNLEDFELKISQDNVNLVNQHQAIITSLEKDLEKIEKKQTQLYDFLENGVYSSDVFVERNNKLAEERERVQSALKVAHETLPSIEEYKEKVASLQQAIKMLQNDKIDAQTKNDFLKQVISVIYYEKNEGGSRWAEVPNIKLQVILK